jgi:hypothetical protein
MKLRFSFIVLLGVASFCNAIPLRDSIGNDNEVNEEMMRGKLFIDLLILIWLLIFNNIV